MRAVRLTRRVFLGVIGALGLAPLVGCGGSGSAGGSLLRTQAFRLSTKGRRASNAAKSHAANMVFVSAQAANLGRAHPGDRSRIVMLNVAPATWQAWFGGGASEVDLRHV